MATKIGEKGSRYLQKLEKGWKGLQGLHIGLIGTGKRAILPKMCENELRTRKDYIWD
jgi:hypothetical protein